MQRSLKALGWFLGKFSAYGKSHLLILSHNWNQTEKIMWENPEREEKSERRSLQPCADVDMRRTGFLVSKLLILGSAPCASQDGLFKRQTSLATLYPGTEPPVWIWYGGNSMHTRIGWTRIPSCVTWDWSPNILITWCEEPTHWKRPWYWEGLRARGEAGDRGWDGWMASLMTQWTCIWANSGRQWKIEKPRVLQSMVSQRVGHNLEPEQQQHPQSGANLRLSVPWFQDF